ncbi:TIGR01459 family HAD-type hydrolase [bacterium NHP-B]|nr:TIGR01459 family HAD-type hydrolase [bacterium NHP-B]
MVQNMSNGPRALSGLHDLGRHFTHVLLDIYGVLHSGGPVFPEALRCLKALQQHKKHVTLFSNAPRLVPDIASSLAKIGIDPSLYQTVLSSGIHVKSSLESDDSFPLGRRFYHLGVHARLLDKAGYACVSSLQEADFILLTGPDKAWSYPQDYETFFAQALELTRPVVCANPDPYVMLEGEKALCAGTLGRMYETMGGRVLWYGKPYKAFYEMALDMLGVPKDQVVAVGDSMWTDIEGATSVGLASVLILTTGVHQEHFPQTSSPYVASFLRDFSFQPTYVMDALAW